MPIRILVVDDHEMFGESVAMRLAMEPDLEVVATVLTMAAAVEAARLNQPDVAVVDYRLPDGDGATAAVRVRAVSTGTQVVILTAFDDDRILRQAIDSGCAGYLLKSEPLSKLASAIRLVHAGEAVIPPQLLAQILRRIESRNRSAGSELSSRELEVLGLLARGFSNPAIAERLFLSLNTIRNHVQRLITKLGAHSKLEAVAIGIREGLITFDETNVGLDGNDMAADDHLSPD